MRTALISVFLIAAGCDSAQPAGTATEQPIDQVYRVSLERIENTCDKDWGAEVWTDLYDVHLRHDGLYDMSAYRDAKDLWPLTFSAVSVSEGVVNHVEEWQDSGTPQVLTNMVVGNISLNKIDLTMTHASKNGDGTPCVQRMFVKGDAWGANDPASAEGVYGIMASVFQVSNGYYICDNEPQTEVPVQKFLLTASEKPDGDTRLDLSSGGERLRFIVRDGAVVKDSAKGWAWYNFGGYTTVPTQVTGTFTADVVDLDLRQRDAYGTNTACYYHYHLAGEKIVPGTGLGGEYRSVTTAKDGCTNTPPILRDESYFVVDQGGGIIELSNGLDVLVWLPVDEKGNFDGFTDGGGIATYKGFVDGNTLRFAYTFKSAFEGRDCMVIRDISATARFIQE